VKELFNVVIRNKVSNLITKIGNGINEIVIDIPISLCVFNTIELKDEQIILHLFKEDLQFDTNFDDLDEQDKMIVYKTLKFYR
jgi:hypothetical protein